MSLTQVFSGHYHAHSAMFGNAISIGDASYVGIVYASLSGDYVGEYTKNGSSAVFTLPNQSSVIFAELVLAGYDFLTHGGVNIILNTPISTHTLPYGTLTSGPDNWVIYHQDVTTIVNASGSGTYSISQVDASTPSILWYVYVVYTNSIFPYKYIYYAHGVEDVLNTKSPVTFTLNNVYTPKSGPIEAYLLVAATRGDVLDHGTLSLNGTLLGNSSRTTWNGEAPYSPSNNIFSGLICIADTNDPNIGLIDTRGTFGSDNNYPYIDENPYPNRAAADLTGMLVSNALTNNINTVTITGTVAATSQYHAPDYLINGMAFEINAPEPFYKTVSKDYSIIGDTLTYSIIFNNDTTLPYSNVTILDTIPTGTTFSPNSLKLNGSPISGSLEPPNGINIGSIAATDTATISFNVRINSTPPIPTVIKNSATAHFTYASLLQTLTSAVVYTTLSAAMLAASKIDIPYANLGDILTYTIPISNVGNATAINIVFIDTIPNGLSFVDNSLKQDSTVVLGNPNPPGITLPNGIAPNTTSTITFRVSVISLPNSNPISNSATQIYQYVFNNTTIPPILHRDSTFTDMAYTSILMADLSNLSLTTSKQVGTCGTFINYTITIPNTGNITAFNVIVTSTASNGIAYITDTLKINDILSSDSLSSIYIGTITPGGNVVVTYTSKIQCE